MGQKVNPIGLRIGVSRKWAFSWFSPKTVHKSQDSAQNGLTFLSQGVVTARGGFLQTSFEEIFRNFFRRFFYFRNSGSRRFIPVHLQFRKGANNHLFFFLFYVKLYGRRIVKKRKRRRRRLGFFLITFFNLLMQFYTKPFLTNGFAKSKYTKALQFDYGFSSKNNDVKSEIKFFSSPFFRISVYQSIDHPFFKRNSNSREFLNHSSHTYLRLEAKTFFAISSFSKASRISFSSLVAFLVLSPNLYSNKMSKDLYVKPIYYVNNNSSRALSSSNLKLFFSFSNTCSLLYKLAFFSNVNLIVEGGFVTFKCIPSSRIYKTNFTNQVSRVAQFSYTYYKSSFLKNIANFFYLFPEFVVRFTSQRERFISSFQRSHSLSIPFVSYISVRKGKNKNSHKRWRRIFQFQTWKKIQRLKYRSYRLNQRFNRRNIHNGVNRKLRTRKLSGFLVVKQKKFLRKLYSLIFGNISLKTKVKRVTKAFSKNVKFISISKNCNGKKKLYRHYFAQTKGSFEALGSAVIQSNIKKKISYQRASPILNSTVQNEKDNSSSFSLSIKERENFFSNLSGTSVSFYRINTLSLARFDFELSKREKEKKKKVQRENNKKRPNSLQKGNQIGNFFKGKKEFTSSQFLQALQTDRRRRYRYVGVFIPDLVRISFISVYSKYSQLLINFFAFTLAKLPRNRKETKYIRFLVKLVKVFAGKRPEIVGLRLRFQGRMNRWRRTKHILAQKGILPLHTFEARISYGKAQAITRKGAFGRRLWMAYNLSFSYDYKRVFYSFIGASRKSIFKA